MLSLTCQATVTCQATANRFWAPIGRRGWESCDIICVASKRLERTTSLPGCRVGDYHMLLEYRQTRSIRES